MSASSLSLNIFAGEEDKSAPPRRLSPGPARRVRWNLILRRSRNRTNQSGFFFLLRSRCAYRSIFRLRFPRHLDDHARQDGRTKTYRTAELRRASRSVQEMSHALSYDMPSIMLRHEKFLTLFSSCRNRIVFQAIHLSSAVLSFSTWPAA